MWSGMSFALISHFWPKKSSRIDQSEDRRHPRLSREVNHKKMEEIKFNFIFWDEKKKKYFFQISWFSNRGTFPDLIVTKTNLPVYRTGQANMKGNKAQIKKDIERFNQQYSVGAVITNSANGVIYHAKRKSDGFTCVVKVRFPTIFQWVKFLV